MGLNIKLVPVIWVIETYRPGSFDRTWEEEFKDLGSKQRIGEMLLRTWDENDNPHDELAFQLLRNEPYTPITLGWDSGCWNGKWWEGRMWAGHHTLWFFHEINRTHILADIVPYGEKRGWPANHCAPKEGWL